MTVLTKENASDEFDSRGKKLNSLEVQYTEVRFGIIGEIDIVREDIKDTFNRDTMGDKGMEYQNALLVESDKVLAMYLSGKFARADIMLKELYEDILEALNEYESEGGIYND